MMAAALSAAGLQDGECLTLFGGMFVFSFLHRKAANDPLETTRLYLTAVAQISPWGKRTLPYLIVGVRYTVIIVMLRV